MNAEQEITREIRGMTLMNKVKIQLWGRLFELNIVYMNYPGEEITENQIMTAEKVANADYLMAKKGVEEYITHKFAYELGDEKLDNIFRFVMPKSIVIPRINGKRVFALLCNFKLDEEQGISIIFENEKYKAVGSQDLIL